MSEKQYEIIVAKVHHHHDNSMSYIFDYDMDCDFHDTDWSVGEIFHATTSMSPQEYDDMWEHPSSSDFVREPLI